jgi:hypothetical protein
VLSKYEGRNNRRVHVLGNFTQRSSLLSEVRNDTDTTTLSTADTFFDSVCEVGFAGTDVGTKDVRTVT